MGLQLDRVVPWGRSLAEYLRMFNLGSIETIRGLQILDCGSGPASFVAELNQSGGRGIACDPLYQFSPDQIRHQIQVTYAQVIQGVEANLDSYLWTQISSSEQLGQIRMQAMERFLTDFATHPEPYVIGELPILPFETQRFDLALCSHFLFTYSQFFSTEFHRQAIQELCRVAREVRIFPLLTLSGDPSTHLESVIQQLRDQGLDPQIEPVPYEFQQGADRQLTIRV